MNNKKLPRIAIVVPALIEGGGVSTVAAFIHKAIQDSGCYTADFVSIATSSRDNSSVRLLAPSTWIKGVSIKNSVWRGIAYQHVGAFLTEFEFQRYMPRRCLTDLLNTYDLVQVVAGAPAWANIAKEVKRPVVLQVATLVKVESRKKLSNVKGIRWLVLRVMNSITSYLEKKALTHVDKVLVENYWMKSLLESKYKSGSVIFAPPGVDADLFHPESKQESLRPYILSVGRFADPRKNVNLLIEAYDRLRQVMSEPPMLVFAGKKHLPQSAWDLIEVLKLRPWIEFHFNPAYEELINLYQQAQLFVLSSDEEGFGMVILEAMACGLPVVSTRCGGPECIIRNGENGFLVSLDNSTELAKRMKDMLSDNNLYESMVLEARNTVEKYFSRKITSKRFLGVYDGLLYGEAYQTTCGSQ